MALLGEYEDEDEGENTFAAPVPAPKQTPQQAIDELLGDSGDYDDLDLTGDLDLTADLDLDLTGDPEDDVEFLERPDTASDIEKIAREMPSTDWFPLLAQTNDGEIKSTYPNIYTIMKHDPRTVGIVAFNEFVDRTVLVKKPGEWKRRAKGSKRLFQLNNKIFTPSGKLGGDDWKDAHENYIRLFMEAPVTQGGFSIKVSERDLSQAVSACARDNAFHPVRDYFDECATKWDGEERLSTWLCDYFGCWDIPYYREVATLILVAAVSRIYEPGMKFDQIPVIEGPQGVGKSTAIRVLASDEWFGEVSVQEFEKKDKAVEAMEGRLMMEIAELSGLGRTHDHTVKSFSSSKEERTRRAYGRNVEGFKRQCVFIGTTNDKNYLKDPTGNRRFWVVEGHYDGMVNLNKLRKNRDQLWGEAVHLYHKMREEQPFGDLPLDLRSRSARETALELQESRRAETLAEEYIGKIEHYLNSPVNDFCGDSDEPPEYWMFISVVSICAECFAQDTARPDKGVRKAVEDALANLPGWERASGLPGNRKPGDTRVRFGPHGQQRAYRRTPDNELLAHLNPLAAEKLVEDAYLDKSLVAEIPQQTSTDTSAFDLEYGDLDLLE